MLEVIPVQDERAIEDWRRVHNAIIPVDPLTTDQVRERTTRNHLEVAYLDGTLAGCSTVRPPDNGVITIIVRVLPEFRRRGLGTRLYDRARAHAQTLTPQHIETIIWAPNTAGLDFALANGFVEVERDGDWIVLRR
ncbi:MAG TPA: GNAT family N-acetyltransferase [Candidatus Limnocylindrales bacterium]|nr:GNAT family N-acetyltransferase [Candidatus Limnocylindrales bacterium]